MFCDLKIKNKKKMKKFESYFGEFKELLNWT